MTDCHHGLDPGDVFEGSELEVLSSFLDLYGQASAARIDSVTLSWSAGSSSLAFDPSARMRRSANASTTSWPIVATFAVRRSSPSSADRCW